MKRMKAVLATIALAVTIGLESCGSVRTEDAVRQPVTGHTPTGLTYNIDSLYPSATAIIPRIYGSARTDSVPGRYRYTYTLVNEPASTNTIRRFVLNEISKPISVTPPPHWRWLFGYDLEDSALYFVSRPDGSISSDWDSLSIVRSIYDLAPGDSLTFGFVSDRAPSRTTFFAQGYYQDSISSETDARLEAPSIWHSSVSGTVIGPGTARASYKSK